MNKTVVFILVFGVIALGQGGFCNEDAATGSSGVIPTASSQLRFEADATVKVFNTGTTVVPFNWTDNSNTDNGFIVERSTDGVNFTEIGRANQASNGYDDTTVANGNTYYYRVRAYNSNGASAPSNVISCTIGSSGITTAWTEQITSGTIDSPISRTNHTMVWDGTKVIMFGGYAESNGGFKNDLWWYDPISNTWTGKIANGVSGSPSARYQHSMVWDGTRVILLGGRDYYGVRNDLWWYDPQANTWAEKIVQETAGSPDRRDNHSMVWDGTKVIMFGGYSESNGACKNDLWWYDPISNTWTEKITNGVSGSPSARDHHSMVWDGTKLIMFGGYNPFGTSSSVKNDLWWYDPISNTWTEKIAQGAVGSPSSMYTSMIWDGIKVIMFGGYDGNYKNDLWWYDPQINTWAEKIPNGVSGSPSARYLHSMVWDGTKVIMFGGAEASYRKERNDLWWYLP